MKRIVRGNDFTMRIPVAKIVDGEKVAFPLPGCTDIVVRLCSAYRRLELAHTIDAKEDNVIVARVEGDRIPFGTYALEVRGKIFGNDWRSNEYEQVAIVDRNADADTELGETDEGEDSVEMDTAVVILPPDRELDALVKEALAQNKAMSELSDAIKASEEGRTKSEELRAKSEEARQEAEKTRASNEAERVQAEQVRENSEGQRVGAEQGRASAESTRVTAESARADAENARVEAEAARVTAENARTEAEAARQEAEKTRATAEDTRTGTEVEREANELTRKTNEQARQANEEARQAAEQKREGDTATAIATMQSDTSAAIKTMQDAMGSLNKYMDIVKLPVVETLATNRVVAMDANKVYRFTLGNELELSLTAPHDKTVTNEYQGSFDTGDVAPAVTWPEGVVWDATPNIGTNSHVEFNIRYTGGKFFGVALAWDLPTK